MATVLTLAAIIATGCGASDRADSAGTASPTSQEQGDVTMITISGELAYRERIALVPGGAATVTLSDTSAQGVAAPVVAETTIELDDRQIPIPFELGADVGDLDASGTYSLQATITGPGADLQWTTGTANQIDITQSEVDLGTIMMVSAGDAAAPSEEPAAPTLVGEWTVTSVDGTPVLDNAPAALVFGDDGSLGGNGGCNSFSTTYESDGEALTIESEIAATLVACGGPVQEQETAMLAVIVDLATYEIADDGLLTVMSSDGRSVTAERVDV